MVTEEVLPAFSIEIVLWSVGLPIIRSGMSSNCTKGRKTERKLAFELFMFLTHPSVSMLDNHPCDID